MQPLKQLLDFLMDESFVIEGIGQGCNTLASGEQMHGQTVGVALVPHLRKLAGKPVSEKGKQLIGFG